MINADDIAKALGVRCIISSKMAQQMELWENMYLNEAAWQKKRIKPMRIPSAVVRELKRLTLMELKITSERKDVDAALQKYIPCLKRKFDYILASGGMLIKPYLSSGKVYADFVSQNNYLPLRYTDDACTELACLEEIVSGDTHYTRIEHHIYDAYNQSHTISNRYFCSRNHGIIGMECNKPSLPEWKDIQDLQVLRDVQRPLFAVFQTPDSNNIDPDSPLGVSVFSDAVDFIRNADEHWERILWELESSERAIDASEDLFRFQGGKPQLPKGRERMFRCLERSRNGNAIFNTFSPDVRDSSYFNSLNQILRQIENAVGLSYGTFSDLQSINDAKTAEEIRASKHRSFSRVNDIQQCLQTTLEAFAYAVQYYIDYYQRGAQQPSAALTCSFGDGILEDWEKTFTRRFQLASAGFVDPVYIIIDEFGCDEETARAMTPKGSLESSGGGLFGDA